MNVQKYKPKSTPRTLEKEMGPLFESCAMLIQNTKTVIERTRKLLKESKKLVNQNTGNPRRG